MRKTVLLVAVVVSFGCGGPNTGEDGGTGGGSPATGGGSGVTGGGDNASGGGGSSVGGGDGSTGGGSATGGGSSATGGGAQLGGGDGTGGGSTTGGGATGGGGSTVTDAGCDSRCIEGDYSGSATVGTTTYAATFRVIAVDPQRARIVEVGSGGYMSLGNCGQGDEPLVVLDGGSFNVDPTSTPQNAQNASYGISCTPGGTRPATASGSATTYVEALSGQWAGDAIALTATTTTHSSSSTTNTSTHFTGTRVASIPDAGITMYWADQGRGFFNFATPSIPRTTKDGSTVTISGQAFIAAPLQVNAGALDVTIQMLPEWWRPTSVQSFDVSGQVSTTWFTATLRVYPDGRVTIGQNGDTSSPSPLGTNAHLNFDAVEFSTQ